jgi:hypothetical protein
MQGLLPFSSAVVILDLHRFHLFRGCQHGGIPIEFDPAQRASRDNPVEHRSTWKRVSCATADSDNIQLAFNIMVTFYTTHPTYCTPETNYTYHINLPSASAPALELSGRSFYSNEWLLGFDEHA